jgi:alpha-L-rhamnosidase
MDTAKAAFLREYMTPDARAISNTQTAYILALYSGILPKNMAERAAQRLVDLIHANQDHLGTGFLGTPYLCPVLTQYGYTDLAYTILRQTTPPSWLYPVTTGATTIWEKWHAMLPDGSLDSCSFNHYAYGAVGDWLYRVVTGITPGAPGYKKIIFYPHIGDGLTSVDASYESGYGRIGSSWRISGDTLKMEIEIPANTQADIWIPAKQVDQVREQGKELSTLSGAATLGIKEGHIIIKLGSGKYSFAVTSFPQ